MTWPSAVATTAEAWGSPWAEAWGAIPTPDLDVPANLAIVDSGDDWIVLECDAVASADYYEVWYRLPADSWVMYPAQFTDPANMIMVNISAPELLEYRVRAFGA